MQNQGEIIVLVDKKGGTQVAVRGVSGPSCKAITEGLEEALGVVITDSATEEMYHQDAVIQQTQQETLTTRG